MWGMTAEISPPVVVPVFYFRLSPIEQMFHSLVNKGATSEAFFLCPFLDRKRCAAIATRWKDKRSNLFGSWLLEKISNLRE